MRQDFFTYLPSEIIIDIISRLPFRTAMRCKYVRKSWRDLIESPVFAESYKSFPILATFRGKTVPNPYKIYELEDVLNHDNNSYDFSFKEAFDFDFPHRVPIYSSVGALLFLCYRFENRYDHFFMCNPVTREYIKLPNPRVGIAKREYNVDCFGFGVSKTSRQFKLVRVFCDMTNSYDGHKVRDGPHCQVYTLGTGSWRSINIPSNMLMAYVINAPEGAFSNGNFHWLAYLEGCLLISCFDLESELFSTLSLPPDRDLDVRPKSQYNWSLFTLREESLCLWDARPDNDNQIVIWLMKEYGDDKSWTKQYVIPKKRPLSFWFSLPRVIKVFKDDEVLLTRSGYPKIICYSNETKGFREIESNRTNFSVCYTPSFLQLKTLFPVEYVRSF